MIFKKLFRKKNKYSMDMEIANQTLQNIFAACDAPPNTVPFDKLVLRQRAHTRTICYAKWLCFLCLLFILVEPLAFQGFPSHLHTTEKANRIQVEKHYIQDGRFHIYLSGSHLDLKDSYISSTDGTVYPPESYDNGTGEVIFPYPGGEINIFISEGNDEYLQIVLTPKK